MTRDEAEARVAYAGWSALDAVVAEMGEDTPPELVVRAVLPSIENHGTMLLRTLSRMPVPCIEALLVAFESRHDFVSTYARVACANIEGVDALRGAWQQAFDVAIEADQGSVTRKSLFDRAKNPAVLAGLIAGMAASIKVPKLIFSMVLASGDESSVDALLPHLEHAQRDEELLDCLLEASTLAPKTAAFEPVVERLNVLLERRAERATLAQELRRHGVQTMRWQMTVTLGTRQRPTTLSFDTTDYPTLATHGLKELHRQMLATPPASAADIPRWLAEQGATREWKLPGKVKGTLAGAERAAFARWLESGRR